MFKRDHLCRTTSYSKPAPSVMECAKKVDPNSCPLFFYAKGQKNCYCSKRENCVLKKSSIGWIICEFKQWSNGWKKRMDKPLWISAHGRCSLTNHISLSSKTLLLYFTVTVTLNVNESRAKWVKRKTFCSSGGFSSCFDGYKQIFIVDFTS